MATTLSGGLTGPNAPASNVTVTAAIPAGTNNIGAVTAQTAAGTVLTQASAAQTANGNSATLTVGPFKELQVAVNITAVAGTTPTLTLAVDTLGADGVWYTGIYTSASLTAAGQVIASLGIGASTNVSFGATVRLRWVIGGTTPSFTFSASIIGK